jgi:hypothetical protein
MKAVIILTLLVISFIESNAQMKIIGHWFSSDSSRIYNIFAIANSYEGILYKSTRIGDTVGEKVLFSLKPMKRKNRYSGYIRSLSDGLVVRVKIRMKDEGRTLQLTLQRMLVLPVRLKWRRAG